MITITSAANSLIKAVLRLRKSGVRKKEDLVIVDGAREISRALAAGWRPEALYHSEELAAHNSGQADFFGLDKKKIIQVSGEIFKKISYKENPDGFLATFPPRQRTLADIRLSSRPLLIILEAVEKPGNIGAILRTAAAAGVEAVIVSDSQTDLFNPNVIRASEGEIFSQIVVKATIIETLAWLKDNNIRSFAAATDGSEEYSRVDLSGPTAVVLGSEADGLSPEWLAAADFRIKIPMAGDIDSLNVSVAAAVIVFEARRQRENRK